jgi:cell volume regulation protein A
MRLGEAILLAGVLLTGSVVASLVAERLRLPALVLFFGVGLGASTTVGFTDYALARAVGIVALTLILFDGGLGSNYGALRSVLRPAITLASAGTVGTALIAGVAAKELFGVSWLEGLMLGSIVASTDGTAVFALLRGASLPTRVERTLEGEAGLNDPVAVLLVVGFLDWITTPGYGLDDMAWLFVHELAVGLACGVLVGRLAVLGFARLRLPAAGMFPVASLAVAATAYGLADTLEGSGFLAVYLAGLALGGARIPAHPTIVAFHQGVAWVAQAVLFVMLGLLVTPGGLGNRLGPALGLSIVLMFLARPIAVFALTARESFLGAERVVLAWAGLRGAVPIVLATFPVLAGLAGSQELLTAVMVVVVLSALVQGASFTMLARALGVVELRPVLPRVVSEYGTLRGLGGEVIEHPVGADDPIVGRRVSDLGLPPFARVTVIVRGGDAIPPSGASRVHAGDILHLLVREEQMPVVLSLLDRWRAES